MKVLLTACNGKLKSELMDIEECTPEINLALFKPIDYKIDLRPTTVRFKKTGRMAKDFNGSLIHEFELET